MFRVRESLGASRDSPVKSRARVLFNKPDNLPFNPVSQSQFASFRISHQHTFIFRSNRSSCHRSRVTSSQQPQSRSQSRSQSRGVQSHSHKVISHSKRVRLSLIIRRTAACSARDHSDMTPHCGLQYKRPFRHDAALRLAVQSTIPTLRRTAACSTRDHSDITPHCGLQY